MKRYKVCWGQLRPAEEIDRGGGFVYLADETDETIMNMVDEFAETAKEYDAELAKKDKEIARLREKLGYIEKCGHDDDCLFCARKDTIARETLAEKE